MDFIFTLWVCPKIAIVTCEGNVNEVPGSIGREHILDLKWWWGGGFDQPCQGLCRSLWPRRLQILHSMTKLWLVCHNDEPYMLDLPGQWRLYFGGRTLWQPEARRWINIPSLTLQEYSTQFWETWTIVNLETQWPYQRCLGSLQTSWPTTTQMESEGRGQLLSWSQEDHHGWWNQCIQ